jgi:hypothetical protein
MCSSGAVRPDLIAVGAALLIVVLPGTWRPARHVITIVHEAGHALTAILVGRRLQGIRLHSDTSGLTVSRGKPYGPGMVCTTLAGYLAPSVLGLVFATLLKTGLVTGLLVVCALLLAGVLIMIRNLYGAVTLLVAGAVVAAVSLLAPENVQEFAAHLITWFLLLGAIRPIAELIRKRRRIRTSDPDQLAHLTSTPAIFWIGSFALISTGALVLAGGWLLA